MNKNFTFTYIRHMEDVAKPKIKRKEVKEENKCGAVIVTSCGKPTEKYLSEGVPVYSIMDMDQATRTEKQVNYRRCKNAKNKEGNLCKKHESAEGVVLFAEISSEDSFKTIPITCEKKEEASVSAQKVSIKNIKGKTLRIPKTEIVKMAMKEYLEMFNQRNNANVSVSAKPSVEIIKSKTGIQYYMNPITKSVYKDEACTDCMGVYTEIDDAEHPNFVGFTITKNFEYKEKTYTVCQLTNNCYKGKQLYGKLKKRSNGELKVSKLKKEEN